MKKHLRHLSETPVWAVLLGGVFFLLVFGTRLLDPTYISWLLTNDPAQHFLGWDFFRHEPWHFPPGNITHFGIPDGTSIVYTDSIPLLAFLFKPLRALLPEPFQYFGMWMLGCYMLQGYFGWRLATWVSESGWDRLLISAFFLLSPSMLFRATEHHSLMGHWLLLAGLLLCLDESVSLPSGERTPFPWEKWTLLLLIASLVHLYILATLMLLYLSSCVSRRLAPGAVFTGATYFRMCLPLVSILPIIYLSGSFILGSSNWNVGDPKDYYLYSMNLLAPLNPMGWAENVGSEFDWPHSYLMPTIRRAYLHQYEGFNYLGAGVLLLLAFGALQTMRSATRGVLIPRLKTVFLRLSPLSVALLLLALFSITPRPTLGPFKLFTLPLSRSLLESFAVFRASGRFFWAPSYAVLLFTFWLARTVLPGRKVWFTALLAVALSIQILDLSPFLKWMNVFPGYSVSYFDSFDSPTWRGLLQDKKNVLFYPVKGDTHYTELGLLAASTGKAVNVAYRARYDAGVRDRAEEEVKNAWLEGDLRDDSLYITEQKGLYQALKERGIPGVGLREIGGYYAAFRE